MKIIKLEAENFKRLRAVSISPDGTLQQITGRNAQGKTSVLDAVWAALGGGKAAPVRPVREGTERAKVSVQIGDLIVTRRWTSDDKSTLSVESTDGALYKSPQAMLDKLVGSLSFDPLAFVRMPAKDQARTLREIAGVDTTILDGRRHKAFEDRTDANRALKQEQARLDALPIVMAPDEPVSVADLIEELKHAQTAREALEAIADRAHASDRECSLAAAAVTAASEALAAAEEAFAEATRKRDEAIARHKADVVEADRASEEIDKLPDTAEIHAKIAAADEINGRVRQRKEREAQVAAVSRASQRAGALTHAIEVIDSEKAEALAAAKFPVPGLSVDDEGPTFNGIPLAQASGAEQLRVGLAVAAALNPTLRTVLVRDGSLLDKDGLELVAAWAAEHDMQVLLERVADGTAVGIVIEDGMVIADAQAQGAA